MSRFFGWIAIVLIFVLCFTQRRVIAREEQLLKADMVITTLSDFWKRPIDIVADVLLPDDYYKQPNRRFPTVYVVHAFGGSERIDEDTMLRWQNAQRAAHSEFIVIFLNANFNGGHHVFADSQNYGPWGTGLTTQFIPATDRHFRTVADASARFLCGHSSGGWSTLWLQVEHPDVFGGVWAISPDPVDFHNFTGPDLTLSPPGNFYHDAQGHTYMVNRGNGHGSMPLEELVNRVPWGIAQFDSFEEVFSPRGADGKAEHLFDRRSGQIDRSVAQYWEQHWDIDRVVRDRWAADGPALRGKIHVFVGMDDTFHLDGPVHRMQDALKELQADAQVTFIPGADHWSVFNYHRDLIAEIVRGMAVQLVRPSASTL